MRRVLAAWAATVLVVGFLVSCSVHPPTMATGKLAWPPTIATEQRLTGDAAPGWAAFEDNSAPEQLTTVGVFEGHPGEQGSLEPDDQSEKDGLQVATWQLLDNGKRHYWIACYYDHTRFALTRPIDPKVATVVITSNPNTTVAGLSEIMSVTLK